MKKELRKRFYESKPGKKLAAWIEKAREIGGAVKFVLKNKKMRPTDKVAFLIFSIPAVMTCPNATAQCLKYCYAKSAYMYDSVCKNHAGNFISTMRSDFVEMTCNAIRAQMYTRRGELRKAFRKADGTQKYTCVRVHESGDFYSKEYMLKWFEIARRNPDLHFFAYTKSIKMLNECKNEKPANFIIRCSIFPDTPVEDLQIIKENNFPYYTAVDEFSKNVDFKCDCAAGCGECGCKCSTNMTRVETILKKG